MARESSPNNFFTLHLNEAQHQAIGIFHPRFSLGDWDDFLTGARARIEQGFLTWELDLREIQLLNSMIMGGLVSLNMVLLSQGGSLTLVVEKDSRIAQLMALSKLDQIIPVRET